MDDVAYELTAPGPGGLVVGLHGLTGTRRQPLEYLAGMVRPQFGVLAPDLPGHGCSPRVDEADFSAAGVAAEVAELVRRLGLSAVPVQLVGVSLGAVVALELALSGRLNVVGAAFVRPAHTDRPSPDHLRGNLLVAELLQADAGAALDRLLAEPEYRAVAQRSAAAAANLRTKAAGPAERAALLRAGSRWTAYDRLGLLAPQIPTLVVAADGDPLHPAEVAREWAARLPGSRFRTVPSRDDGPAHVAAVTAALGGFLAGAGEGARR